MKKNPFDKSKIDYPGYIKKYCNYFKPQSLLDKEYSCCSSGLKQWRKAYKDYVTIGTECKITREMIAFNST